MSEKNQKIGLLLFFYNFEIEKEMVKLLYNDFFSF
jgi:hypothetical protein